MSSFRNAFFYDPPRFRARLARVSPTVFGGPSLRACRRFGVSADASFSFPERAFFTEPVAFEADDPTSGDSFSAAGFRVLLRLAAGFSGGSSPVSATVSVSAGSAGDVSSAVPGTSAVSAASVSGAAAVSAASVSGAAAVSSVSGSGTSAASAVSVSGAFPFSAASGSGVSAASSTSVSGACAVSSISVTGAAAVSSTFEVSAINASVSGALPVSSASPGISGFNEASSFAKSSAFTGTILLRAVLFRDLFHSIASLLLLFASLEYGLSVKFPGQERLPVG